MLVLERYEGVPYKMGEIEQKGIVLGKLFIEDQSALIDKLDTLR